MPLIIAVLLGLTAALIVVFPLLGLTRLRPETATPGALAEGAERERDARQALREVELDYTLGNLDSGDYDALRGRYERRALSALRTRYQREQELDALIERQLDALRANQTGPEDAPRPTTASTPRAAAPRPAPTPRVARRMPPRDRRAARDKRGNS